MKKNILSSILVLAAATLPATAQQNGITDTRNSKYAVINSTPIDAVKWTGGFWGERFGVFSGTSVQSMWETWKSDRGHSYNNFLIAAGEKKGKRHGPAFHDGDMYKWLEAVAAVYAVNKDPELDKIMDEVIRLIAKAQRPDGYLHTPVIIADKLKAAGGGAQSAADMAAAEEKENEAFGTKLGTSKDGRFGNPLNFEAYNLGHLITAGIIHKRATGKTTLFDCAVKAADCLYDFYMNPTADALEKGVICPSHYMGVTEMYRETGNPKYLELSKQLINIRDSVKNGTDDNQDRIPFRQQYNAIGHSVRANYLYAGVADLYVEDGEAQLKKNLDSIWNDIVYRKMYINGACGALYDGTSPDGTEYKPDLIQKVHQSYGRAYQLPNSTAHNETCANIGNMLFNWRMLESTGDAKYADIVETALYNSVLSGVSLDGKRYFYTNPLRLSDDFPYTLRWPRERQEYISCFCCPPNTLRTICEAQNYAYTVSENALWCNLYGQSELTTKLGKHDLKVSQVTGYPYDGKVVLTFNAVPKKQEMALHLRIPAWCDKATVTVNGEPVAVEAKANTYATINRVWKKGDVVTLDMEMRVKLMESNPLVEETRNQVVVKRGPLVYCLEGMDMADGKRIDDVLIPADIQFTPKEITIDGSKMVALEGEARLMQEDSWDNVLYREVGKADQKVKIQLIPYFAWGNRGKSEMTVWMPLAK